MNSIAEWNRKRMGKKSVNLKINQWKLSTRENREKRLGKVEKDGASES